MKSQTDINSIKTCSRCGLCAQVCPIFEIEKNEASLTRGKFLQLLGILRDELKYNKKIEHNLKLCINCGKCRKNCPSDINTVEIFSNIKNNRMNPLNKFLKGEFVFNLKLFPIKILKFFSKKKLNLNEKEIYFKGCLSNYSVESSFKCCGVPFFVEGKLDVYKKMVAHNLELIENENVEKVFFDCATCFNEVKNYPFKNPKNAQKLKLFGWENIEETKFTFFKPCHLDNIDFEEIEKELKKNKNYVSLYENNKKEPCCGFGGDFFIRHPFIAHKLSLKLAEKIYETGAKTIIAPCPTCNWSINWGLWFIRTFKNKKHPKIKVL